MAAAESRVLKHTTPLKPPQVLMDAVKINAPHQTPPPRSGDTPRSVFVKKVVGGVAKILGLNFGSVKING
jgi:hypothetical protein